MFWASPFSGYRLVVWIIIISDNILQLLTSGSQNTTRPWVLDSDICYIIAFMSVICLYKWCILAWQAMVSQWKLEDQTYTSIVQTVNIHVHVLFFVFTMLQTREIYMQVAMSKSVDIVFFCIKLISALSTLRCVKCCGTQTKITMGTHNTTQKRASHKLALKVLIQQQTIGNREQTWFVCEVTRTTCNSHTTTE